MKEMFAFLVHYRVLDAKYVPEDMVTSGGYADFYASMVITASSAKRAEFIVSEVLRHKYPENKIRVKKPIKLAEA